MFIAWPCLMLSGYSLVWSPVMLPLMSRLSAGGGTGALGLCVGSRGVSAPLTKPQHWRRNRGRLVEVRLVDGSRRTERIRGADEEQALLDSGPVRYAEVQRATIQVEFNRPADPDLDEPDEQE